MEVNVKIIIVSTKEFHHVSDANNILLPIPMESASIMIPTALLLYLSDADSVSLDTSSLFKDSVKYYLPTAQPPTSRLTTVCNVTQVTNFKVHHAFKSKHKSFKFNSLPIVKSPLLSTQISAIPASMVTPITMESVNKYKLQEHPIAPAKIWLLDNVSSAILDSI